MADFSKQWCDLNDPDMPWDFDIEEIANGLKHNFYIPYICEGFGFSAIGKFAEGIKVYIRNWTGEDDEQPGEWVKLENLLQKNK
jgi:hypothetical protein